MREERWEEGRGQRKDRREREGRMGRKRRVYYKCE